MHIHHLTLQRQTNFLRNKITGAKITDSYTQLKNEWIIALELKGQEGYLQLSCDARYPYIVFLEQNRRAKNSTEVMAEIIGLAIAEMRLIPGERIIEIRFENSPLFLLLQFFTVRTNFFLLDSDFHILNAFKSQRSHAGKIYELPQGQKAEPTEIPPAELIRILRTCPEELVNKALRQFQYMTGPVVEEILFRGGIFAETPLNQLAAGQIETLVHALQSFIEECRSGMPGVYFRDSAPERFSLTTLHHLKDLESKEFDDINSALRFFCFRVSREQSLAEKKSRYSGVVERKIQSLKYALTKLEQRPADPEKEAHYQKIGELIASQPHLLKGGVSDIALVDYFHPDMPNITVKIDPRLSAQENAQIYFEKAKQSGEKIEERRKRKIELETELHALIDLKQALDAADSFKALEHIEGKLKAQHILSYQADESDKYRLPYKKYEHKGYEIWVGRSAQDNDVMTFKHAAKEDVWLHVQGYSGSHVVVRNPLRQEQIPGEVLEYAARLAVSYSAAKHASYVPVVYTRVKHVRKPRKSPPGSVLPVQVKTVFVDPL